MAVLISLETSSDVPATNCCCHSNFLGDSCFFHDTSPKPWFLQLRRGARFATADFCSHEETTLFKHLQVPGRFTFLFHHLSSTWELS